MRRGPRHTAGAPSHTRRYFARFAGGAIRVACPALPQCWCVQPGPTRRSSPGDHAPCPCTALAGVGRGLAGHRRGSAQPDGVPSASRERHPSSPSPHGSAGSNASMRSRRSSSAYGCPSRSEVETPSARAQAAMRAGEAGFCPHSTFDKSDLETLARWASPCCNKPRCLRIRAIRAPVCSSMLCGTMNSVLRQHSDGTRGRQSQIRRTLISSVTRQEPSSRRRPAVRRPVRAVFRSRTGPWPRQANAPAHSPSQAAVRTQRR
jgi:hypothetical protein